MEDSPPLEPYQRLIYLLVFSLEKDALVFWGEPYWPTLGHTVVFVDSDCHPIPPNSLAIKGITLSTL
jgi:hypothetical protein